MLHPLAKMCRQLSGNRIASEMNKDSNLLKVLVMSTIPISRTSHQLIGICLIVCFLFVSTTLTQNLSAHLHHGGHDQQTHEQTWCSWSCQAGQGIDILTVFVENLSQILTILDLSYPTLSVFDFAHVPTSRGPPFLLS